MIITISGTSGAGKSTAANILSERLGFPAIDTGAVVRKRAAAIGLDVVQMSEYRLEHPEVDREVDRDVVDECRQHEKETGGCILQGRLAAWMTKKEGLKAIRIWMDAPAAVRAERIAQREGTDPKETMEATVRRDRNDWQNYLDNYGIDLNDLSVYDIVVPTGGLDIEGVASYILNELQKYG